ncbi:Hypothetical predicted protein [Pelobates cultripes]|uniref:Uncharacterized protein n=1 Tax=Pelobates cultripes TaxID=61616 RepID=A0AAD1RBL5_PELCU|nr:Hypothetical predicted protein [Pelobates cultripes]
MPKQLGPDQGAPDSQVPFNKAPYLRGPKASRGPAPLKQPQAQKIKRQWRTTPLRAYAFPGGGKISTPYRAGPSTSMGLEEALTQAWSRRLDPAHPYPYTDWTSN